MFVGLCEDDGCRASELKNAGLFMIFRFLFFFLAGGNSLLHVPRTLPGCEIQLQIRYLGCGLCHLWASYFEEDLWCYCKSANQDGLNNLVFITLCYTLFFRCCLNLLIKKTVAWDCQQQPEIVSKISPTPDSRCLSGLCQTPPCLQLWVYQMQIVNCAHLPPGCEWNILFSTRGKFVIV